MSEYMFNDLSRIFITMWFRHQEQHAKDSGKPYRNDDENLVCNWNGCEKIFKGKQDAKNLAKHQRKFPEWHESLLYVYLSQYLVFKTDIAISVNAIMMSANRKDMFFRM
jgi:hypothetical protein